MRHERILFVGMVVSIVVMTIGLVWFSIEGGEEVDMSPMDVPRRILDGDPVAMIDLGIILLIATPAMRLVTAMYGFIREGDLRYGIVAMIVLLAVMVAVVIGAT